MELNVLTTKEAAERLGVTQRRVSALILSGKLPAQSFGNSWMIAESDLALVSDRKPGRPPKVKVEATAEGTAGQATNGATNGAAQAEAKPRKKGAKKKVKAE